MMRVLPFAFATALAVAGAAALLLTPASALAQSMEVSPSLGLSMILGTASLIFVVAMYFLPTILAVSRHHRQAAAISALNVLLGWTMIGWVVALVWALVYAPSPSASRAR